MSKFARTLMLLLSGTSVLLLSSCSMSEEAVSVNVILVGTGSGTVTSSHPHADINCSISMGTMSGSCFDDFDDLDGTPTLMLTATPQAGSVFVNWSLCRAVQGNVCTIDVTQPGDYAVTARFDMQ